LEERQPTAGHIASFKVAVHKGVMSMNSARFLFSLTGFITALALAATGCNEKNPAAVETPPAAVDVALPLAREVTDYQVFTARTQAVESVDVKARVTGYLEKIDFKDGDDVKQGQVLFAIERSTV
jgi:multidrug efflux pump subunit AcrA (membrane-fusion protein)